MANTSLMSSIGIHATAESALPTLPASPGTNIAQSAWASAGFETVGAVQRNSDDYDIDNQTLTLEFEQRIHKTMAPLSHGHDEAILLGFQLNPIEIVLYDFSEELLTLSSAYSDASSIITLANTLTPRTVGIEINNKCIFEFPKCIVTFPSVEMGRDEDQVARATMRLEPLNVSGHNGGLNIEYY